MARNLDPKCKRCRRAGEKLFLKGEKCFTPKCPLVKRAYPPGMHGPKLHSQKPTEFGIQLAEKQKTKNVYGLLERQFSNYVKKAMNQKGDSGENLLRLLELRLDNVIYRMGLAVSRSVSRQLVLHNHILVNNKKVNIPSFKVRVGDIIEVAEKSKKLFAQVAKSEQKKNRPSWIEFEPKNLRGKIVANPPFEEVKQTIKVPLIIEYYSR